MEPANRLLWFWCQRVAGGGTQKKGQETWVSVYFPGHLPRNNCMFPRKRSLSLRRERARWLPALLLPVAPSWPLLLASAGRRSCLPVSSPATATLEMAGRAQEYEVGLCPFFYPMIFFLILCIICGLLCFLALYYLISLLRIPLGNSHSLFQIRFLLIIK